MIELSPNALEKARDAILFTCTPATAAREIARAAITAYLSACDAKGIVSPRWLCKKRGSTITEIGRGFAQVAEHPIEEMTAVVIYRGDDGYFWVRNAVEFDDGRFAPLPPHPQGAGNDDAE